MTLDLMLYQMRILQLRTPHHHQLDHRHWLNREVATEEKKDPDRVSEYLYIHFRMQGSDEDSAFVDPHNRVSDRSRSPQEREGSRRQGPQTQKGKKTITENQPSNLPSAQKHNSSGADEDDQEPQNEPGTSSTAQLTEPVLPLHQVPAASFQKTSCNCNT